MQDAPQLHSSIVAMVSLASGIASNHPDRGQCQLDRLRQAGVPQQQIDTVIEIARHIRDEAAQKLDAAFDAAAGAAAAGKPKVEKGKPVSEQTCCTPTASGQSCC
ncbi:hypothetical protein [Thiohalophilus thiocyanatoxydans]|uniref:Uncharacterized protein n=1 Tax=Thiohalophilus thiocyanatoxydans TaxID=381308 RepID=A0A4R8IIU8_9GAMM|nr:hypothetical protein [Thiohalophilus thiocyanatoxydans]TDY00601.1 hypothetical protein EDC23_2105 [Thiohalophilus thiocyanatoxydans]